MSLSRDRLNFFICAKHDAIRRTNILWSLVEYSKRLKLKSLKERKRCVALRAETSRVKIVVLSENDKCMYKIRARQVVHLLDVGKFVLLLAVKDVKQNVIVGKKTCLTAVLSHSPCVEFKQTSKQKLVIAVFVAEKSRWCRRGGMPVNQNV